MDDLLSKDESEDYSTPTPQTINTQVQVHQAKPEETSNSLSDSATDSSLETSSIEVIQPSAEGLEIRRLDNPPPRVPPPSPQSPHSNVVADISGLITEDDDSNQVVPPTINPVFPETEVQGRQEIYLPRRILLIMFVLQLK